MTNSLPNQPLQDVHVRETVPLVAPRYLKQEETISDVAVKTVIEARESIKNNRWLERANQRPSSE